jgi:hypothetical protein
MSHATPGSEPIAAREEAEAEAPSGTDALPTGTDRADQAAERRRDRLEVFAVVVLSVTTVLTAWTAFQASKWSGAMSISFSQASAARIESSRLDAAANVRMSNQIALWTQWVTATGDGNKPLAQFILARFPEPLAAAHRQWLAEGGQAAPASSPFYVSSYVLPEHVEAQTWNDRADAHFRTALDDNQRGDNYTILTVLFASVLFFVALSSRVSFLRAQRLLLAFGSVLGAVGVALLLTFPKLV